MPNERLQFVDLNSNGSFALGMRAAGFQCVLAQCPTDGQAADYLENNVPGYGGLPDTLENILLPGVIRSEGGSVRSTQYRKAVPELVREMHVIIGDVETLADFPGTRILLKRPTAACLRNASVICGMEDRTDEIYEEDVLNGRTRHPLMDLVKRSNIGFFVWSLSDKTARLRKHAEKGTPFRLCDGLLSELAAAGFVPLFITLRPADFGCSVIKPQAFIFAVRRAIFLAAETHFNEKEHAIWSDARSALRLAESDHEYSVSEIIKPFVLNSHNAAGTFFKPLLASPVKFGELFPLQSSSCPQSDSLCLQEAADSSVLSENRTDSQLSERRVLRADVVKARGIKLRRNSAATSSRRDRSSETAVWESSLAVSVNPSLTLNKNAGHSSAPHELVVSGCTDTPNSTLASEPLVEHGGLGISAGSLIVSDADSQHLRMTACSIIVNGNPESIPESTFAAAASTFFSLNSYESESGSSAERGSALLKRCLDELQTVDFSVDSSTEAIGPTYKDRVTAALQRVVGAKPVLKAAPDYSAERMAQVFDGCSSPCDEDEDFVSLSLLTDKSVMSWMVARVTLLMPLNIRQKLLHRTPERHGDSRRDEWERVSDCARRLFIRLLRVMLGERRPVGPREEALAACRAVRLSRRLSRLCRELIDAASSREGFRYLLETIDTETKLHFVSRNGFIGGLPCAARRIWDSEMPRTLTLREVVRAQGFPDEFVFHGSTYRNVRRGKERRYLRIEEGMWTVSPYVACAMGDLVKTILRLAALPPPESVTDNGGKQP